MNNKDLFNAIDKAAEEYVDKYAAEGMEDAGCERPVVLRPEKKPRSVRKIVLGAAACAAAGRYRLSTTNCRSVSPIRRMWSGISSKRS